MAGLMADHSLKVRSTGILNLNPSLYLPLFLLALHRGVFPRLLPEGFMLDPTFYLSIPHHRISASSVRCHKPSLIITNVPRQGHSGTGTGLRDSRRRVLTDGILHRSHVCLLSTFVSRYIFLVSDLLRVKPPSSIAHNHLAISCSSRLPIPQVNPHCIHPLNTEITHLANR